MTLAKGEMETRIVISRLRLRRIRMQRRDGWWWLSKEALTRAGKRQSSERMHPWELLDEGEAIDLLLRGILLWKP